MQAISIRTLWTGLLGIALVGALLITTSGDASAGQATARAADTTKITIEREGRKLFFDAPDKVDAADRLKIVNHTNPRRIGPHTFSLTKPSAVPKGLAEKRACARLELPVCEKVFKAHKVNPQTFEVGRRIVDSDRRGWDSLFEGDTRGDSWFTDQRDEKNSRAVRDRPGKKWGYFCLIHPNMKGEIEVK